MKVLKKFPVRIGPRDFEVLASLDLIPLSVRQLLQLSETFEDPFPDEATLRRRLRQLQRAGLIASWRYATASAGRSPSYFRLTRTGFRFLYGDDHPEPNRRFFEPLAPNHHQHTFCLADFVTKILVSAHRQGVSLRQFAREGAVCLEAAGFRVFPDAAFRLCTQDGRVFNFVVELDRGTERVRSRQNVESIQRKLQAYDAHQATFEATDPSRYLVLFITTRSAARTQRILDLAAETMSNPHRTVFLAAGLSEVLACDPLQDPAFRDHRGLHRCLLPLSESAQPQRALSPSRRHSVEQDSSGRKQ